MDDLREHVELTAGGSNEICTDIEKQMARNLFSEAEDGLRALDEEIARTQKHLGSLQEKRFSKVERMDRLRVAFAPHKYIPAELWAKIFVYCLGDTETIIPPDQNRMPYVLGMVCSRWRLISHAEHSLWNKIYLSPSTSFESFEYLLPFIGNLLIDIRVEATYTLLDIFATYSHRIHALDVILHRGLQKDLALAESTYPFTALESLDLTIDHGLGNRSLNPWISLALNAFSASGNLHRLKIACNPFNYSSVGFPPLGSNLLSFPLHHLSELTMSGGFSISYMDLLTILQLCKSLARFNAIITTHSPPGVLPPAVTLESLCILSIVITGQTVSDFDQLLTRLTCPSLKSLELDSGPTITPFPEQQLIQFISRSSSLAELVIAPSSTMSLRFFEQLVWSAQTLEGFSFRTCISIPEAILDSIRKYDLVPNIQRFSVWVTSSRALSELLADRWRISDVNVAVLDDDFEAEEEMFTALEISLEDAGRKITFIKA